MKTCNRWLLVSLAFASGVCASKPSTAQGLAAQSAKSAELERAGKYAEATPLAQAMLANQQGAGVDRAVLASALPPLPDTADELDAVAKDLGAAASDIHLGADASETSVNHAPLADYRIVYFAIHGLVAGDVKGLAEPSLALSIPRVSSELDDGLLTASEVAQLKLNADWDLLETTPGIGRAEALREAMLAYLEDASSPKTPIRQSGARLP
jgi:CHAT domain-containing protein